MQYKVLKAVNKKLMLGVVIKLGMRNEIYQYQTSPEINFAAEPRVTSPATS